MKNCNRTTVFIYFAMITQIFGFFLPLNPLPPLEYLFLTIEPSMKRKVLIVLNLFANWKEWRMQ